MILVISTENMRGRDVAASFGPYWDLSLPRPDDVARGLELFAREMGEVWRSSAEFIAVDPMTLSHAALLPGLRELGLLARLALSNDQPVAWMGHPLRLIDTMTMAAEWKSFVEVLFPVATRIQRAMHWGAAAQAPAFAGRDLATDFVDQASAIIQNLHLTVQDKIRVVVVGSDAKSWIPRLCLWGLNVNQISHPEGHSRIDLSDVIRKPAVLAPVRGVSVSSVETTDDGIPRYEWRLDLGDTQGSEINVLRRGDHLLVSVDEYTRSFELASALKRCHSQEAAIDDHGLSVLFEADQRLWPRLATR